MSVVCIGETMAAFRSAGPLRLGGAATLGIAGSESNVAIGLVRLGVRARWCGVVGDDELGVLVVRTLRAEGVEIGHVRTDGERPTGLMVVEPAVGGRRRVHYYRRGSAGSTLAPADVEAATGDEVSAVVTSGITSALGMAPAEAARVGLETARKHRVPGVLAVNFRSALWSEEQAASALVLLAKLASVVIGSENELALAAGSSGAEPAERSAQRLLGAGVAEVVQTRGGEGASVWTAEGRYDAPAVPVAVVDPVGAGDAFTAGYLAARLGGADPQAAVDQGVLAGACCVASAGDWEGLATPADLALLRRDPGTVLR